ncbi:MAG: DUF1538 domain-containing protein [Ruminococcaceae bacterium]|nr:DUF1538 domain-containing protein [Oscillospiraceae bacterium]
MRSKFLQAVKETFYSSLPLAFGFVLGAAISVSEPAVTVLGVSVAETHEKAEVLYASAFCVIILFQEHPPCADNRL